jgi:glycerol uptake facilitator
VSAVTDGERGANQQADRDAVKERTLFGELCAEFAGTMILILFGCGVVAQVVIGNGVFDGGLGNHDSIAWGWGLGVTLGVYTAGRMTGAHINPAVTITMAVFRGLAGSSTRSSARRSCCS